MMHANGLEITQTAVAGCGVLFKIWLLQKAYSDITWLRVNGFNGPRRFWATSRVRQEWMLFSLHLACFLVGIASLFLGPPWGPGEVVRAVAQPELDTSLVVGISVVRAEMGVQGELRLVALIFVTVVLALFSAWNLRDRHILVEHHWDSEPWDGKAERREVPHQRPTHARLPVRRLIS